VLLVLCVLAAVSILIDPFGDFPLNDDWAYAWSVRHLLETGEFRLSDWAAANLYSQVLWGALFGWLFGFSFTTLRLSTLVLAAAGAVALYATLRQFAIRRRIALLGTLSAALVPTQVQLAHSFNNDVPSTSLLLIAAFLLLRGSIRDSTPTIAAGIAAGYVSILARQSNLLLFVAYGLAVLAARPIARGTVVRSVAPGLGAFALHAGYQRWLAASDREPLLYDFQVRVLRESLAEPASEILLNFVGNLSTILLYLGLLLLPFLLLESAARVRGRSREIDRAALAIGAVAGVGLLTLGVQMPLLGNTLLVVGLGPAAATGHDAFLSEATRHWVDVGWKLATVAAAIGASMLLRRAGALIVRAARQETLMRQRGAAVFLLAFSAFYTSTIAALPRQVLFDRYAIPLLPFAILIIALASSLDENASSECRDARTARFRATSAAAHLIFAISTWYSIVTVRDYLDTHRTRWIAARQLQRDVGARADQIDGGFEFNGWNRGNVFETCSPGRDRRELQGKAAWSDFECIWASGKDKLYSFSFVPRPGWDVIVTNSTFSWQFLRRRSILTLRLKQP